MQEIEAFARQLLGEHRDALAGLEQQIQEILKLRGVLFDLVKRDGTLFLCGATGWISR